MRRSIFAVLLLAPLVLFSSDCSRKPEPKPVGTSDARVLEAAPHLEEWLRLWRAALPGLRAESLYASGTSRLRGGLVQPLRDFPLEAGGAAAFEILSVGSPDHRYKLVFDIYKIIEDEDGEVTISEEADSAPLLVDLRDSTANRFESCGTPCGFDWGVWIAPTRFVLGGWAELEPPRTGYWGTIGVYSITDSTSFHYHTRAMSNDAYSRYRAAWETWLRSKYQAVKIVHRS